ncbi:hypothetical protein BFG57_12145 [Bacillus solimangrovi]|uniref:Inner membrane protein YgaP-like transmembrane domain-containing protein n=1 Tax=Bacillus solimangrovi TaxID=1305675 RepID=A0A1E5LH59_9BACI|nr:hypothetical protein BFG57_12145 [Bacillus solimangrovi]
MKPNISLINALMRITCGFTILAWGTSKMVRRPYCASYLWVTMAGAMKVAEGITRYCPMVAMYDQMKHYQCACDEEHKHQEEEIVNPS